MLFDSMTPPVQFDEPSLIYYQNAAINRRSKSTKISGNMKRKLRKFAGRLQLLIVGTQSQIRKP